jgi:hypothetical protein
MTVGLPQACPTQFKHDLLKHGTVLLPSFQIIKHSKNLGESKNLKFDKKNIEKITKIYDIK